MFDHLIRLMKQNIELPGCQILGYIYKFQLMRATANAGVIILYDKCIKAFVHAQVFS